MNGIELMIYMTLIFLALFIPLVATVVLGSFIAAKLGLTGIVWWAFMIIFYLIITGIITRLNK